MAIAGEGTKIQLSIASTLTDIADVTEISGPKASVADVETTTLSSTTHTYRPGLPDYGEVNFTINYSFAASTHAAVYALLTTPAIGSWKIIFSDTHSYAFSAFLTAWEPGGMTVEENLTVDITLRITGAVVAA